MILKIVNNSGSNIQMQAFTINNGGNIILNTTNDDTIGYVNDFISNLDFNVIDNYKNDLLFYKDASTITFENFIRELYYYEYLANKCFKKDLINKKIKYESQFTGEVYSAMLKKEPYNDVYLQNFKFQEVSGKLQFLKGSYIKNISDYKYSYWESSYDVYLLKLFYYFAGEIELRFWTPDNDYRGVAKFDLTFVDAQKLGANGVASIKTPELGYVKIFVEAKKGSEGWLRITTPTLRRVSFYLGVRSFTGQNFEIQAPPLTTCPIVYNTDDIKLEWNITDNINVNLTPVETVIS